MSVDKNNQTYKRTSFLTGVNSDYIQEYYALYLQNPDLLTKDWIEFFEGLKDESQNILQNINYELDGEFAWFIIDQNMMSIAKASKADVEGFSDFVRTIKGVEVSMMIMENEDQSCRLNFRSTGKYIINGVAVEQAGSQIIEFKLF